MSTPLLSLEVRLEQDVVLARQRAREIASLLNFDFQDQVRVATAVSEIVRNAFQQAGGCRVEFLVEEAPQPSFVVAVSDRGPGIQNLPELLDGRGDPSALSAGIAAARRLLDRFEILSQPGTGTRVLLGKFLPRRALPLTQVNLTRVAAELARRAPLNPYQEVRDQNQELLRTLEELAQREAQLTQVNQELKETNHGVLALYSELDEKAEQLRRASEMKSRFLSNMSHEFRTPLNSIRSLANILLDRTDGELAPEQIKQVTFIRKAAEDLTELVNDLLDLAKVEAGKVALRLQQFEVAALFGALRGTLRPLLTANSAVALIFDDPGGLAPLHTDEGKVSQVLRNFISNALKFTERGEVRVSARPADASPPEAGLDDAIVFAVSDTGIGIAAEDQDIIFQEFTQIDSARQRRVKGTGLGLPLSRKLAELLGGRVGVQSTPGVGSTFTLTVPRVYGRPGADQADAAVSDEAAVNTPQPAPREKVLLIDDNEVSRYLLRGLLAETAVELLEAANGEEGLRLAEQERPRAIFLDLDLPDHSGFEILTRLRQQEATRGIPVIIRTSRLLEEAERRRLFPDVVAILSKAASRVVAADEIRESLRLAGVGDALSEVGRG